ncbi:MAG: VanZ family protein [Gammaproteobacteria bacterium]
MPLSGPDSEEPLRRVAVWLLALTVAFIVYASLYPFDFELRRIAEVENGWARALAWRRPPRSDIVANLLFYLPFGALVTLLAPRRWGGARRVLFALAAGTALSLCVECAQLATRDRDPALSDVVMNGLSAALAAAAVLGLRGLGVQASLPELRRRRPDLVALLLIGAWIAFHAAPFMPTVRFLRYFRMPELLLGQNLSPGAIALHFAGYVILAAALRALLRPVSFWSAFACAAAASLLARIAFRGQYLALDECIGLAIALPWAWHIAQQIEPRAYRSAAIAVASALCVHTIAPLDFSAASASVGWLPGAPIAHRTVGGEPGPIETVYLYLGLTWLAHAAGARLSRALPWLLTGALLLEWAQAWQPGRRADLLGPLVIVGAAFLLRVRSGATAGGVAFGVGGRGGTYGS